MQVRVLGPIQISDSAGREIPAAGAKLRGLIALLALDAGRVVSSERLIDGLWGDRPVNGQNTLQVAVSKLRRLLADAGEPDRVLTQPSGYQLDIDRDDVDALRFESLLRDAHAVTGGPDQQAAVLGRALDLWRGDALADGPDTAIPQALGARLDELRRSAVEDLVEAELALGRHGRLVAELEALVEAAPLRERLWGQLMRALYGSGQQAEALRAFQRARDTLVEQMGVEPSPELRALEAAVLAHDDEALGAAVPGATGVPIGDGFQRRGNVRHPIGECIGRDDDLEHLVEVLGRHRLVTLTGPGGVGKTRLALELAVAITPTTPNGVWWVELAAALSEVDALVAVRRALQLDPNVMGDRSEALSEVARVLDEDDAVLVMDNCEHLLGPVELIVEELLGRCGRLRVVATSRERIGVRGELDVAVAPLALAAAVTLFERSIEGQRTSDDHDRSAIADICDRVDRLPLAVELAAARARHMRLPEILERLTERVDLLEDGARTPRAHQRDLRAVAAWSYDLLSDEERTVFQRLSVFADGATLKGARRVCADATVSSDEVERVLDRLVDKSLIYADRSGAETRFRLLQTLADYAADQLVLKGEPEDARRAHALWVAEMAGAIEFGARTTGAMVATVQDEDVAVRDAVTWALEVEPVLALQICLALAPFWFSTMRVSVGANLLASALEAAGTDDAALRSSALAWAVLFRAMVHDAETSDRLTDEAIAYEETRDDALRLGVLCFARGTAAGYRADDDATPWLERARRHFTAAESTNGLGHVTFAEGAFHLVDGELDQAVAELGLAIEIFRAEDDHLGLILAVSRLGEAAWRSGDLELYATAHADLLDLGREGRSSGVITGATARLAHARLAQGRVDEAQELAQEALASSGASFMSVVNGYAFRSAGLVNLHTGHVAEGRSQLQTAVEAFERGAGNVGVGQAALCWLDLSASFHDLGEADDARRAASEGVATARASGDPWVLDQAEAQLAGVS